MVKVCSIPARRDVAKLASLFMPPHALRAAEMTEKNIHPRKPECRIKSAA